MENRAMEPEQPRERNSIYFYFLQEAPELLSVLEQELLSLSQEDISITKVHTLLRTTHTLKGAAASAGLETIQTVAHSLEDVFRVLCRPNVEIDPEAKALIFEGFECLRLPLVAEFSGNSIDHAQVLDQTATIFAQLQEKLGDYFDQETQIPTSEELGFDLIQSIFETGVAQRLDQLSAAIAQGQQDEVAALLQTYAENFAGVGESLGLPGFEATARTTLAALVAYPEQAVSIAQVALEDFRQGQLDVLAGDRTQGGQPSTTLLAWGNTAANQMLECIWGQESEVSSSNDLLAEESLNSEIESPLVEMIWGDQEQVLPQLARDVESITVDQGLARSPGTPSVPPRSPKKEGAPARSVRIDVEHLEALNYLLAELLTTHNRQSSQDEGLRDAVLFLLNRLRQYQHLLNQLRDCSDHLLLKSATVSVPSNRPPTKPSVPSNLHLDTLELDQYGELQEVVQTVLEGATKIEAATDTINLLTRQGSLTLEKQRRQLNNARDVLMEARMLPLGEILHRFLAVLQQLETLQKKPVTLQLSGTEVLVDKAVAERLYDPLLHIVRNAFDHGIESPEIRRQAGKPEQGQIEIRACDRGGQLVIEVQDDGQGLNYDKIRQRAVEGQFVLAQQVEQLSTAQLSEFLFKPGFSTAAQVNELSGRGVGLDVVQTQIQLLQGSVTVQSQPQRGTTFLLRIPLSLTVARLLLCQAGSRTYGFLAEAVELVLLPRIDQLWSWEGGKVLRWGKGSEECSIPVYSLADSLIYFSSVPAAIPDGLELLAENPQPKRSLLGEGKPMMPIMLIRYSGGLLGIEVDKAIGEQELVVRPLGVIINSPLYVYGSSVLASSQLALVIDGAALAERLAQQVPSKVKPSHAPLPVSKPPQLPVSIAASSPRLEKPRPNLSSTTLLIVEDSVTVRQALMTTLQKAGYQVLQAQHGQEAISLLQQLSEISLVICDIEMPRMNGFEFLNYRQQQPNLARIPVVMLTSRSAEKHRKIAMTLGASAYLTKPYMEQELLTAVADSIFKAPSNLLPL